MVGAVGIEPITQSNSTAPEHRRAALLRRVCKGTRHPKLGAAERRPALLGRMEFSVCKVLPNGTLGRNRELA